MTDKEPVAPPAQNEPVIKESQGRPNNPHGNPGHHPSTDRYGHSGSKHSSKDR